MTGGSGMEGASDMGENRWTFRKPYDLRERLLEFSSAIVRISQFLHAQGGVAVELSGQLVRCGTSAGANYEEADDGSSGRDALAKLKIVLRELKETRFCLKVARSAGLLTFEHDPVVAESDELVRIVATVNRRRSASK